MENILFYFFYLSTEDTSKMDDCKDSVLAFLLWKLTYLIKKKRKLIHKKHILLNFKVQNNTLYFRCKTIGNETKLNVMQLRSNRNWVTNVSINNYLVSRCVFECLLLIKKNLFNLLSLIKNFFTMREKLKIVLTFIIFITCSFTCVTGWREIIIST